MSTVLNVVRTNPIDLRELWTTESMGVCHSPDNCQLSGLSRQEADECKLISDSCKKVGNQWLVPYPCCKDPSQLPDNRTKAEKMLFATERKLAKNPQNAEAYGNQIKEMVENNFGRKLSEDESRTYAGPVHYVSHHAVIRPDKKSTPVRIVFNSLNDYWMKGPNFLNRLFGVLLIFRQHEVALCADISKMYHMVMIPEEDQQVHRFLWRSLDQNRKPDVYVMKVVTFGDKPSPAMAQMALRKTAEEGADKYPEAASAIKKDTYMDGICVSVPTVAEAEKLSSDIDKVLADRGFKVKGWRSIKALSRDLDETEGKPRLLEAISDDKILGVVWENDTDIFSYKFKMSENAVHSTKITRRGILSQVARIFDPIGFTTAFVIRAKIGLQKMWEKGLDWDDVLPEESQAEWRRLFEEMEKLSNIRFERLITPAGAIGRPTLCIFCDASLDAFGAVAYLRWEVKGGRYDVRFLTAKSRVAPLKQLTVPRLELQGTVLASRLYTAIMNEMTLNLDESRARSFKKFVATRVGEIQGSTNPSQWRHIPGDVNVADDLTRGLNADQLNDRWHRGPDFLRRPKSEWPEEAKVEKKSESEQERRKEQSVMVVTEPAEDIIDCTKFSSWRKLVRVASYVLKFVKKLKSKCKKETGTSNGDANGTLTSDGLQIGENYLIRKAQRPLRSRIYKGELKALSSYRDDAGIIRVGGRLDRAKMSFDMVHPVLLPYEDWISRLITRYVHEIGHNGVAATTAKGGTLRTCCCTFSDDFLAVRGQPARILSDDVTQFIGAERELRDMIKGWSKDELKEFCAEKNAEWAFTTPGAPHQNGCAESMLKSCKHALKKAIGEHTLTPFELYTVFFEVANLVNQRPIGRISTVPDDGKYLCPNDMLLGRASSHVAQGPFRETRNPRHRVEFIQEIANSFWKCWTRDVLPLLAPCRKWNVDRRNIRVGDVVMMADANAVRGKWTIARVNEVFPGPEGKVRNVKVKTPIAEYRRPITKIVVIHPVEGYED
nr:uncharacterized protein LOC129263265 [Lytechinus pictus]